MSNEDVPLTLGTAGHIDHGKTALITLLTGKNTDRLREERERGISIELGYAELELPSGRRLSVVDVPGHERFVRTMVAGATGADLFLLVIAADDGVMPQTREHVAILELLGVRRGVVALTKADLVDDELLELARGDIREFLAGTAFAGAPVVCVSARDGRGVAELLGALEEVTAAAATARRDGPMRLPIDRVFTLKGIGTVVTGTIWQGQVRAGDELAAIPGGTRVVVRSVQVHDRAVATVRAGSRCGINLRGAAGVERGMWLVGRSLAGHVTRVFDAWVSLPVAERPLRAGAAVRLHHGTAQFTARVSPLEDRQIEPGGAGPALVRRAGESAVEPHDRFVLRSLSPVATIGGGQVLDTTSRRWGGRVEHARYAVALHEGDLRAACLVLAATRGEGGVSAADLVGAGATAAEAAAALAASTKDGTLECLGGGDRGADVTVGESSSPRWYVSGALARAAEAVRDALARQTRERPEHPFVAHAELAAAVPEMAPSEMTALLQRLVTDGVIVAGEGGFAAKGSSETLSEPQRRLVEAVAARVAAEPLAPPTLAVLGDELHADRRALATALSVLVRRGDLVRVKEDLWFSAAAVDDARRHLVAALSERGQVTLAEFRDKVETGRRNAQALLELFDKEGLTRRQGDVRVPRSRR